MTDSLFDIDALSAPAGDGEILIQPSIREMASCVEAHRHLRPNGGLVLLDRSAAEWGRDSGETGPVILTGHQPSFYHPGVWAKQEVAAELADRIGGSARMLLVDSDVPHPLTLAWPDPSGPTCRVRTSSPANLPAGQAYEHLTVPDRDGWRRMFETIERRWSPEGDDLLDPFADGFLNPPNKPDSPAAGYVDRWQAGMRSVQHRLGAVAPAFLRVGEQFAAGADAADPAAPAFVAHLLLNAGRLAADYNGALVDYRARRGIRGRRHPIPDLAIDPDRIETPFWMVHPGHARQRAFVSLDASAGLRLHAGDLAVCQIDPDILRRDPATALAGGSGGWSIRPRALAQTMYARLLACDLFIHGIGGAKYDQITDAIIRAFFGVEPPVYGCVSATLRLRLPRFNISPADLRSARHRARDIRYNPQRYLTLASDGFDRLDRAPADRSDVTRADLASLISQRAEAIESSRRLRAERRTDRAARRDAFDRIHRSNAALIATVPRIREDADRLLARLTAQFAHDRVAGAREWFFALYPAGSLQALRETLRSAG